ncbi:MAG: sporulation initiation factor Spo0A C-terminal domain-containing protein [Anaerovoracaceae bacterium]|jgi:two-component system response regulator (stage 0 sporulation protein A)
MNLEKNLISDVVNRQLVSMGIPVHFYGFLYLQYAITLAFEEPRVLLAVSKELYPVIAARYGVSSYSVQGCIARAIKTAWEDETAEIRDRLKEFSGRSFSERPTNAQFMKLTAMMVRNQVVKE